MKESPGAGTGPPVLWYEQAGAATYREVDGEVEILLVTASHGRHWTIPKGHIDAGCTPRETAAKEAYEEAGVHGNVSATAVATYDYRKGPACCRVKVFTLLVTTLLDEWPERGMRARRWFPVPAAARTVGYPGLRDVLLSLPRKIDRASNPSADDPEADRRR